MLLVIKESLPIGYKVGFSIFAAVFGAVILAMIISFIKRIPESGMCFSTKLIYTETDGHHGFKVLPLTDHTV